MFIAGNHQIPLKLPAIDADVPILIGMDVLHGVLQSIIDCGRGFVAFPTLAEKFWMCERLAGGHLAVCLTAPTWWTEVPKSILWAAASSFGGRSLTGSTLESCFHGPQRVAYRAGTVGPTADTSILRCEWRKRARRMNRLPRVWCLIMTGANKQSFMQTVPNTKNPVTTTFVSSRIVL